MKIVILGNSVAMRIRPIPENGVKLSYPDILERKINGANLINLSRGSQMISNFFRDIDSILRLNPDFYIINLGIVESCPRAVPYWLYTWMNYRHPLESIFTRLLKDLIAGLEYHLRRNLIYLRSGKTWMSEQGFINSVDFLLRKIKKETNATIIILGINKPSERVEIQLPGSIRNAEIFDRCLRELSDQHNCFFIDTNQLIPKADIPDGVHFNIKGHQAIADHVISIMDLKY